jgi:hypothetical protein
MLLSLHDEKYFIIFFSIYNFVQLYGCVGVAELRGCVTLVMLAGILLHVFRYRASACICYILATYRISDCNFLRCSHKYAFSIGVLYTRTVCVVFICTPFSADCIISKLH